MWTELEFGYAVTALYFTISFINILGQSFRFQKFLSFLKFSFLRRPWYPLCFDIWIFWGWIFWWLKNPKTWVKRSLIMRWRAQIGNMWFLLQMKINFLVLKFWGWIFLGLKNPRNLSVNLVPSKTLLNHPLKGLSLKLLSGIHVKYIVVLKKGRYVVKFSAHFMKLSQPKMIKRIKPN